MDLRYKITLPILTTAFLLTGCGDDDDPPPPPPLSCETADICQQFTIFHTNDHHGRFWNNGDGEYGMAARKTLLDQLRAEVEAAGGEHLLLSGGDINTGVPQSDLQDAVPDFVGMNLLGYDAMAIGNHEFDNPLDVLDMQEQLAEFPLLSANIYDNTTNARKYTPYTVFTVGAIRIAVVGFTTEDTARIGNPEFISGLTFTDPREEAPKILSEIQTNEEVDLIFATTHMGHYENGNNGSNAPGDVALANSLPAGELAAIIGGHSQNPVCVEPGTSDYADFDPGDACMPDQQNGTWIMQAHEWGKYVGRADFQYYDGQLELLSYTLVPVNLRQEDSADDAPVEEKWVGGVFIEPDSTVQAIMKSYNDAGSAELDIVIAQTNGKLEGDRDIVRNFQTNLGRLIATAQYQKVNADFGVMNSGGVRDSIAQGDITYGDVLTVQPFGNSITTVTMSGAELTDYMGVVASKQRDSGAYPQLINIELSVDCATETAVISTIGGEVFDINGEYTFTVPSFNAAGGDGYPVVSGIDTGFIDAQVLRDFMADAGTIDAASYQYMNELSFTNSDSTDGCFTAAP